MSNLEKEPDETVGVSTRPAARSTGEATGGATGGATGTVQVLEPREVPLGGPRAMLVRRTLPQRERSLIGAWCFIDHYGPELTRMVVPPHPHTGLQTVSWLFAGDIEHRDSVGSLAQVRPGELNLMTAGSGIAHSEVSGPPMTLHGAQLWVALPAHARDTGPAFDTFVPQPFALGGATVSVFIGQLAGRASTARVFSGLVGAQLDLPAGTSLTLEVDPGFEHGILVDTGSATVGGTTIPQAHLGYLDPGRSSLTIESGGEDARLLLLGGTPLGEQIVMWWNFIGRTHEDIVEYRAAWQAQLAGEPGRFGTVDYDGEALPAPELPNVRLSPRG